MKQAYSGSCQCGKVTFDVTADIDEVISCNCSRCGRLGALLAAAQAKDFKLKTGEGTLSDINSTARDHHYSVRPAVSVVRAEGRAAKR